MKNFTRRVCGLLAGITALSAIQVTMLAANAAEPGAAGELPEEAAIVETVSQDLNLNVAGETAAIPASKSSSTEHFDGIAAWGPKYSWLNTYDDSQDEPTFVCGKIKCHTVSENGAKTFTGKTLTTKSGWVDAEDEITIKLIEKNPDRIWCAQIEYPVSNGTKTAFVPLSALSINTSAQAGVEKHARTAFSGVYCRPGVSYPTGGSIARNDPVYVIGTKGAYTQVMYPTGSTTGNYPYLNYNNWKLAWIKTTDARNYLVSRQWGASWSDTLYEGSDGNETIESSGCGLLSIVNAVYHMNGKMIAPEFLAQFSKDNGCREKEGTNSGLLISKFCAAYGTTYGIKYKCSARDDKTTLRNCMKNGCVAVAGVRGHLIAVVKYDASDDTYLVFDSYGKKDSDGKRIDGIWLSENELWYTYREGICNAPVTVIEKQ